MAKRHMGRKGKKRTAGSRKAKKQARSSRKEQRLKESKTAAKAEVALSGKKRSVSFVTGGAEESKNAKRHLPSLVMTPNRSILKKRRLNGDAVTETTDGCEEEGPTSNGTVPSDVDSGEATGVQRKQRRLVISKRDKEKLLALQGDARRGFLRKLKMKQNPNYAIILRAKALFIKLRKSDAIVQQKLCRNLYDLMKGKSKELMYSHDYGRMFQACLKFGGKEVVEELFDEVKDEIMKMAKSKYARHVVVKLLKYGTVAHRAYIAQCLKGTIPQLSKHVFASDVVAYVYEFGCGKDKLQMIKSFFGNVAQLSETEHLDMETMFPTETFRKCAMENVKQHLMQLVGKPVLQSPLIHRLLRLYVENCGEDDLQEIIESFGEHVLHFVHTFNGATVALRMLWKANAKQRKTMVKAMRGHVLKVCTEKDGFPFLLSILDVVDETALLAATVLKEIFNNLDALVSNTYGIKVLCYLMAGRKSKTLLFPGILSLLAAGDGNGITKKCLEEKHKEIVEIASPLLVDYALKNMSILLSDGPTCILLWNIINWMTGDKKQLFEALSASVFQASGSEQLLVDAGHVQFLLAKLLCQEKKFGNRDEPSFAYTFVSTQSKEHLKSLCSSNSRTYILLRLFETDIPYVQKKVVSATKKCASDKVETMAMQILVRKIAEMNA